jgi:exonuclease SbcD
MAVPFRFIHAADLHLDSPYGGFAKAPEHVRERLADSTFAALRRLTDAAIREQADFIVLSGDLFDAADRSLKAQLQLAREWERLGAHGIHVYAIHGNHDPLNGARAELQLPGHVHIFDAAGVAHRPAFRRSGELAAFVYGVSYGTRAVTENLAAGYRAADGAPFHIAMLHGNVGGDAAHDPYAPCALEELTAGDKGINYWALGHIHGRRVLHEYPHVVYSGNLQGRNPRETGAKGAYVVDVSASGDVKLAFLALDDVRWHEQTVGIDGIQTEQELLQALVEAAEQTVAEASGRPVMLRFHLAGRGALHEKLAERITIGTLLEQLQEELSYKAEDAWVHVYELAARTGAAFDWAELAGEDSFAGELYRLSERLADDEELWREFARAAVAPLASHARASRYVGAKLDELPERWLQQGRELALQLVHGMESEERG